MSGSPPTPDEILARVFELLAGQPLHVDDLPDIESPRVELIDGCPYVTPLADVDHQEAVAILLASLRTRVPAGLAVYPGVNVYEGDTTLVMPDVAVADRRFRVRHGLGVSPQGLRLVIEITSSATRRRDLTLKRELYREWGVPCLIIDRGVTPWAVLADDDLPEWARDLPLLPPPDSP